MHNARMSHSQYNTSVPSTTNTVYFTRSYAKINVTLDILGKRPDGYHELATIMQTIDLYDTICFSSTSENQVQLICNRQELNTADNLVVRAAEAIRKKLHLTRGVSIELQKRVPVAAGLGGGSSNAAAVLVALQRWWQLPLSQEDLWSMAADLGSDVPFFLTGGLALCEGRGERITPLPAYWPGEMRWLLLVKPTISVSTATVFRNLTAQDYTNGVWSRTVQAMLRAQGPLQTEQFFNGLERGVLAQYEEVAQARQAILAAGATNVRLSGSGPTLFSVFSTLELATKVQQQLIAQGMETYLTRPTTASGNEMHYF
ncbi:MAG TPA: 4-(cytidine 5'-diphospho)-2-C-methyl-D-erythritol kinase [Dictyobacter sp.]|nr:4-(cytidine 5'-diphospho)-2-C-methyl-D-erythritol kinase [Dictyobacter sp.]